MSVIAGIVFGSCRYWYFGWYMGFLWP